MKYDTLGEKKPCNLDTYIVKYVIPRVSFEERSRTINVKNKRSNLFQIEIIPSKKKEGKTRNTDDILFNFSQSA